MWTTVSLLVEVKIDCYVKPNRQEMAKILGSVLDAGMDSEDWDCDFRFDALTMRIPEAEDGQ